MIFACLTSSLEKCCYPSWSRAGCTVLSQFSAHRGPLCECASVCVLWKYMCAFLLGRCFPMLVTLHHSDRGEHIVGGGEERDEACEVHYSVRVWLSAVAAEEEQRASEFPELDVGGLGSLNPRLSILCLLGKSKETLLSPKSELWSTVFLALKEELHNEL